MRNDVLPHRAYSMLTHGLILVNKIRFRYLLKESSLATETDKVNLEVEIYYLAGLADGLSMALGYLCPLYDPFNPDIMPYILWRRSLIYLHYDYHSHVISGGSQLVTKFEGNTKRQIKKELFREELFKSFGTFSDTYQIVRHLNTIEEKK